MCIWSCSLAHILDQKVRLLVCSSTGGALTLDRNLDAEETRCMSLASIIRKHNPGVYVEAALHDTARHLDGDSAVFFSVSHKVWIGFYSKCVR